MNNFNTFSLAVTETQPRQFASILTGFYRNIDHQLNNISETIQKSAERVAADPIDGMRWEGEKLMKAQALRTLILRVLFAVNGYDGKDDVVAATTEEFRQRIVDLQRRVTEETLRGAKYGSSSTCQFTNTAEAVVLSVWADSLDGFSGFNSWLNYFDWDIKESQMRNVVMQFQDLAAESTFVLTVGGTRYRKVSALRAEATGARAKNERMTMKPSDEVIVRRIPQNGDVYFMQDGTRYCLKVETAPHAV